MNDQEFRDHVVGSLARMENQLEAIPDLRKDVDDLKLSRARDRGIAVGLSTAVSVTVTIFKTLVFGK
jgi:hypothetical protein